MGIVIITIPGKAQRKFVNDLHRQTEGEVDLVIIQKPKRRSIYKNLSKLYRSIGLVGSVRELWYAILLRLSRRKIRALSYFRINNIPPDDGSYVCHVLETDSVNSDEIFKRLKELSPELLVIWGSTILDKRIIDTAKKAINLHFGYCPHYRGALANQNAVLDGELEKIGATIHYVNGKADAGDILELIKGDSSRVPAELFSDLNTIARRKYVDIAERLYNGEELPSRKQDHIKSRVLFLRQWMPSVRYQVAKKILAWESDARKIV